MPFFHTRGLWLAMAIRCLSAASLRANQVHGSWSPSHASRILYPPYVLIVRKLLMQNGLLISTQTKRKSHILFIMHVQKESERKKNGSKRTTRTRDTNTGSKNIAFPRVLISRPLKYIISCFTTQFTASSAHRHHRQYTVN